MMYHFLANLLETGILCKVRNITVHFTIYLYVLDDVFAIGFQSAIKVMQVLYAGNLACRSVEQFCRYGFGQRVISFCFQPDTKS